VKSNSKVLVAAGRDAAAIPLFQKLMIGSIYRLADDSNSVRITGIYREPGTGDVAIEGDWARAPAAGQVYSGALCQELRVSNITQSGRFAPLPLVNAAGVGLKGSEKFLRDGKADDEWLFTNEDLPRAASAAAVAAVDHWSRKRLLELETSVTRGYRGPGPASFLRIHMQTPESVQFMDVDLKAAGVRKLTLNTASGAVGRDALRPSLAQADAARRAPYHVDSFRMFLHNGGGKIYPVYTDPAQLPKFSVRLRWAKDSAEPVVAPAKAGP
jgi:hypothetical protein